MILSTISFGYKIATANFDSRAEKQLIDNISNCIPEEATLLGIQFDKYPLGANFIFVVNVNITYESEATLKLTRDTYRKEMVQSMTTEIESFLFESGVIYQPLSFD